MKRTTQIAFGTQIFHIEEEGYYLLNEYLKSIEEHFRKDDPTGEIKQDFEERVLELFQEKTRLGHAIITKEIVTEVIERVGNTNQLFDEKDSFETDEETGHGEEKKERETQTQTKGHKTFYRSPDDKVLAGVLGGAAAYLHFNSTVLRLVYVLFLFSPLSLPLLLCYVAFWLFTKKATTVSERLKMSGEEVSPDSIWKKISEESHNIGNSISVSERIKDFDIQEKFNKGVESFSSDAKSLNWKKWIWTSLLLVLFGGLVLGAILFFFPYLPDNVCMGRDLLRDNFYSGYNLLGGSGSVLLLIIPIFILILGLIFGGLFVTIILPIGIIIRTDFSPIVKTLLIIGWFILLYIILG